MGFISKTYIKNFVCRYDKEVGVPYFSYKDFKGFKREEFSFNNSLGIEIHCFYYYYDNYKEDKIVMFCHGLGPGHVSYLAEIEALARHGYKVLALDYTGCGESEGDNMGSINAPARDIDELLDYLKLDKPVILVGHSLGGFSALKIASIRKEINKVVVFAPIILFKPMILAASKSKFITHFILKYERKVGKQYDAIDLTAYLKSTEDKIFFIQSEDDPMVPYETSLKIAEEANNPNIQTLKFVGRKHNPNYTEAAVKYMNEVFGGFTRLTKYKKIESDEERIAYFKDVSIKKLTEQDEDLFNKIENFIDQ